MYEFFIGIDVSKSWINVACRDKEASRYLGQFSNSAEGYEQMIRQLKQLTEVDTTAWFVCLENTGSYSKGPCKWLWSQAIPYKEEMPLRLSKSMGLSRGKSDKYDAQAICTYAYRRREELEADVPADPACQKIRKLLSRRALLVKKKTMASNSLVDQQSDMDKDTYEMLSEHNQQLLDIYNQQIEEIEKCIKDTIKANKDIRKNDTLAQSVIGVGPIISATIIAFTGNYSRFSDARKLASYISIAPYPNQSGTTKKGKDQVHPFGNKFFKAMLSKGAQVAVQYDNELQVYFKRKMNEGKAYGQVLNAVKNKLIYRVFAVIKRQTPYVPLARYAQ